MVQIEKCYDHFDWAKKVFLEDLIFGDWAYHPMYFGGHRDLAFWHRYASFLGVRLIDDNGIWDRDLVEDVCRLCPNHLFIDPNTGLWVPWRATKRADNEKTNRLHIEEFAQIAASSPVRADRLTLIYDQSIDWNYQRLGHPKPQSTERMNASAL